MPPIRTFVAVETSPQVRDRAGELIQQLRDQEANVKWVERQNLHLTLNFLGDVDERTIHEVCAAVCGAAETVVPFNLEFCGFGAFPQTNHPRTLWIGVREGQEEVCQLQEAIATALAKLGFPKDRRKFQPHLTVGRLRQGKSARHQLPKALKELTDVAVGTTAVDEVVVFSSQLRPAGPIYEALTRAPLGEQ